MEIMILAVLLFSLGDAVQTPPLYVGEALTTKGETTSGTLISGSICQAKDALPPSNATAPQTSTAFGKIFSQKLSRILGHLKK